MAEATSSTALGFEASLRETRRPSGGARPRRSAAAAARAVLRPLRRAAGRPARSVADAALRAAASRPCPRPQGHRRARRLRRQGPGDDLRRGLPRLEGRDRRAAGRHHHPGRGRGGGRLEVPAGIRRGQQGRAQGRRRARLRHRHVGPGDAGASPRRCAAWSTRRSSCAAPTATCIRACSAARRATRSMCSSRIIADLHDENGRITIPDFYDGVPETPTQVLEQWREPQSDAGGVPRPGRPEAFRPARRAAC